MKNKRITVQFIAIFLCQFVALSGCASVPVKPETGGTVFQKSVEDVQKASVNAIVELGFDVTKSEPSYVEGYRPRKWGFFTGSGGETCGVWMESLSPSKTSVHVSTARTSFGIIGQRIWDDEILAELRKELGSPE